MQGYLSNQLI